MSRYFLLGLILPVLAAIGGCPADPPAGSGDPVDMTPTVVAPESAEKGDSVAMKAQFSDGAPASGVTYEWFQTYGRAVEIINPDSIEASFVAPSLPIAQTLLFRLDVTGPDGTIYSKNVSVLIAADPDYELPGSSGGNDPNNANWEEQLLKGAEEELAKSDGVRAQEFADLLRDEADADGNRLYETDSGLRYVAVVRGDGARPVESDTVRVHYSGWLEDGAKFDSSVERGEPSTFGLTRVIAGWTEGLQLMRVGSHYRFVIPSDLGYGESGNNNIPGGATLFFDVYLLGIE